MTSATSEQYLPGLLIILLERGKEGWQCRLMKLPGRRVNWIRREIKGGMESEGPHFELFDYVIASVFAPAK